MMLDCLAYDARLSPFEPFTIRVHSLHIAMLKRRVIHDMIPSCPMSTAV